MQRVSVFLPALLLFILQSLPADSLLSSYLSNDLDLKNLALEVQKSKLNRQETSINNGLSIQLSTGTAVFRTAGGNSYVSFSPYAQASIPQADNLSVSVSSDIKIEADGNSAENTSLSFSADIISGNMLSRKISLMKAERSLLEAKRALQNRALAAEKEFYTELKSLFTIAGSIISAQQDLYDDTISFEEIKAKGYSTSSSRYRSAEMKVVSDRHKVETKQRELEHDCAVFASKCGAAYKPGSDPFAFLPKTIPQTEIADVTDFDAGMFTETEKAEWTYNINTLSRKADRNFTLSGNAGYTFGNSNTNSDSADIGAKTSWSGLSVGAGISIPIKADNAAPTYTFYASVDPSEFGLTKINDSRNKISAEQELIAIESAKTSYDTALVDQQTSLTDIQWEKKTNAETYNMYEELERDMDKWYKAGVVKESEYLSANANKELYRIKILINDIDLIIYNNTTKLLFCRDNEITE